MKVTLVPVTRLAPLVLVAAALMSGCGGDDSVNPTNPDAGPKKTVEAGASDGSKDGPTEAAKASTDAEPEDAATHEAGSDS